MIFRPWTPAQFKARKFVSLPKNAFVSKFEHVGLPLYSSTQDPSGAIFLPGWASDLFYGVFVFLTVGYSNEELARLSAAAIRSDDPDAFVESVLAAYALGGWRAALQVAEAQGGAHAEGPA